MATTPHDGSTDLKWPIPASSPVTDNHHVAIAKGETGYGRSMGSQRVEYDLSNEHFQAYNLAWVLLFLARVELWTFITYWHLLCLFFLIFLYKIDMAFLLLLTTKFKDYALNPLGRSIREITVFVMQIL